MEFIKDFKIDKLNFEKAKQKAIDLSHKTKLPASVIRVSGEGIAVVGNGFQLNRLYYHGEQGKKMFFDVLETYNA